MDSETPSSNYNLSDFDRDEFKKKCAAALPELIKSALNEISNTSTSVQDVSVKDVGFANGPKNSYQDTTNFENLDFTSRQASYAQENFSNISRKMDFSAADCCSSNSSMTDGQSSLGILSVGKMSDFSMLYMPKLSTSSKLRSSSMQKDFEHNISPISDDFPEHDFDSDESKKKLDALFGNDAEEVKAILADTSSYSRKESSIAVNASALKSKLQLGDSHLQNKLNGNDNRLPQTPTNCIPMQKSVLEAETPFTKLLKCNQLVYPKDSMVSFDIPPFGDRSSLLPNVSSKMEEAISFLNEVDSQVVFSHDQISAQSSGITDFADTNNSELEGGFDSLAYQRNFTEFDLTNCIAVDDSEFQSGEAALKMIMEDRKHDLQEKELACESADERFSDKMEYLSMWSVANQSGNVNYPSGMFVDNSSASIGQVFQAGTECLGTLSNDPNRERPYFGCHVTTPVKEMRNQTSEISSIGAHTFNKGCEESVTCSPSMNLSEISRLISSMSPSDNPASVLLSAYAQIKGSKFRSRTDAVPAMAPKTNDTSMFNIAGPISHSTSTKQKPVVSRSIETYSSHELNHNDQEQCVNEYGSTTVIKKLFDSTESSSKQKQLCDTAFGNEKDSNTKSLFDCDSEPLKDVRPETQLLVSQSSGRLHTLSKSSLNLKRTNNCDLKTNSNDLSQLSSKDYQHSCCDNNSQSDSEGSLASVRTASSSKTIPSYSSQCCQVHSSSCRSMPLCPPVQCTQTVHSVVPVNMMYSSGYSALPENCASGYFSQGFIPVNGQTVQVHCMNDYLKQNNVFNYAAGQQHPIYVSPAKNVPPMLKPDPVLIGPDQFKFPLVSVGYSGVGILVLKSTAPMMLYHFLKASHVKVNGKVTPLDVVGVEIPTYVHSSDAGSVEIHMPYSPKFEGEATLELKISSSPSLSVPHLIAPPLLINVTLPSECPRVSLSYRGSNRLQFNTILEDSKVCNRVVLDNSGSSDVAVHLKITEPASHFHMFQFHVDDVARSDLELFLNLPFYIFCKIKAKSQCLIPVIFISGKCSSPKYPDEVLSRISVTVGNDENPMPLKPVLLSGVVGRANLHLQSINKNSVVIKSQLNQTKEETFSLVNTGNINVSADLIIQSENNCFSVIPETVELTPNQPSLVTVRFEPTRQRSSKGLFQAAPQSFNLVFDLATIVGEVTIRNPRPNANLVPSGASNPFLMQSTNKYLHWGGVQVGDEMMKTFRVLNSSNASLTAKASIVGNAAEFMLVEENMKMSSKEFSLNADEWKLFTVIFKPSDEVAYSSFFLIRPRETSSSAKFKIPLVGYGGVSNIKPTNIPSLGDNLYTLQLNATDDAFSISRIVMLQNCGSKPAFLKIVAAKGPKMDEYEPHPGLEVDPSQFVLKVGQSKSVRISMDESHSPYGILIVYFGDELMRQKIRRFSKVFSTSKSDPRKLVNFNVLFEDEDSVPIDSSIQQSEHDFDVFYETMKHFLVKVKLDSVNEMDSFLPLSVMHDSDTSISSLINTRIELPVKDSDRTSFHVQTPVSDSKLQRRSSNPSSRNESELHYLSLEGSTEHSNPFSISPSSLMLNSECRDGRLIITNHSSKKLKFKLDWSANLISASPSQGTISPNDKIGIRVKALCNFNGNCNELCEGYVKVTSYSIEQHIPIHVNKRKNCSVMPLTCPGVVDFSDTAMGSFSESKFCIKNTSSDKVYWSMYLESDDKAAACNVISSFTLFPSSGILLPTSSFDISAKFSPRQVGSISEEWTLKAKLPFEEEKESKITFNGMGLVKNGSLIQGSTGNASIMNLTQKKSETLIIQPETVTFGVVKPYTKKCENIIIKNYSDSDCKMTVTSPDAPFEVSHSSVTIKSRFFSKLPVIFYPKKPSHFAGVVTLKTDDGQLWKIKLGGICS